MPGNPIWTPLEISPAKFFYFKYTLSLLLILVLCSQPTTVQLFRWVSNFPVTKIKEKMYALPLKSIIKPNKQKKTKGKLSKFSKFKLLFELSIQS